MPGPKKVPCHLKVIRGTASSPNNTAATTPALPAVNVVPNPPRWMKNPDACAHWNRLAPLLVSTHLLNAGNLGLLEQLCATHGYLVRIWREDLRANAALIASYRMLSNSLGMLGWDIPKAQPGNRFAKNASTSKTP
jgi:phage terminase small subunit